MQLLRRWHHCGCSRSASFCARLSDGAAEEWPDGEFLAAQFKEEINDKKLDMLKKLFKFECEQVITKLNAATWMPKTKERTQQIDKMFAQQRATKRLKITKTNEGQEL